SSDSSISLTGQCSSLLMLRAERPESRSWRIKCQPWGYRSSLASLRSAFEITDSIAQQPSNLNLRDHGLAREGSLREAGYSRSHPPDLVRCRNAAITVSRTVIVPRTKPTDEGSPVLLMQGTTPSIARWAAEPWTLPLLSPECPFPLKLNDLCLTVDGNGNLRSPQTTNTQHRVIF